MSYALAPSASYCEIDGRLIVLDRRRDRYLCLTGQLARCLRGLNADAGNVDTATAERLVAENILVRTDCPRRSAAGVSAPVADASALDQDALPFPKVRDLIDVGHHLAVASWSLRHVGLERALCTKNVRPDDTRRMDHGEAAVVVGRFEAARRVLSRPDKCLRDSIALRRKLAALALPGNIVIGVRLAPFKAHCWVQQGGLVLNETVDGVQPFTPILVL